MIKAKLIDIINGIDVLNELSKKQINISAAYNLSKIIKYANEELNNFNESRKTLCDKYGTPSTPDENGMCTYQITEEYKQCFTDEINELVAQDIDIPANKIDLTKAKDINISATELFLLDKFIIIHDDEVINNG